jgi:hypothetical protein
LNSKIIDNNVGLLSIWKKSVFFLFFFKNKIKSAIAL